jgi:WG containing repeat
MSFVSSRKHNGAPLYCSLKVSWFSDWEKRLGLMMFQRKIWWIALFVLILIITIISQLLQIPKTENLYPITVAHQGSGYINQAGNVVIEPKFIPFVGDFSEGLAPVPVKDKWGFIDLNGQIRIPPKYDYDIFGKSPNNVHSNKPEIKSIFFSFSEGLSGVLLNDKWGFIDRNGKLVIPYQFDEIQNFSGGVAMVKVGNLFGVINREGKWIISPIDESPIKFFQGISKLNLISVNESGQFVGDPNIYWDKLGQLVGTFKNPPLIAKEFQEGLAIMEVPSWKAELSLPLPTVATSESISIGRKCGFQDEKGVVVIAPQFDGCQSFSDGLAAVQMAFPVKNGWKHKWGYIDRAGKFVVKPQFDYADRLVEERGLVVSDGKIGFIDKTGKVIIKLDFSPNIGSSSLEIGNEFLREKFIKYSEQINPSSSEIIIHRFSSGLAMVGKDNKCGYIDKTGNFAIKPEFVRCDRFDQYGVAEVAKKQYSSLYINRQGKTFARDLTHFEMGELYPTRIKFLVSVIACLLWIIAISCHEFGHAIVAYWGGDHSVKDKGYLSFNPLRYVDSLHSIVLPAVFLLLGGYPLPGAAVYIDFGRISSTFVVTSCSSSGTSCQYPLWLTPVAGFSCRYCLEVSSLGCRFSYFLY